MALVAGLITWLIMVWCGHLQGILEMTANAVTWQTLVDTLVVTAATVCKAMGANQRKQRHIMIESRVFPECLRMTIAALRQRSLVGVLMLMTAQTFLTTATKLAIVDVALITTNIKVNSL